MLSVRQMGRVMKRRVIDKCGLRCGLVILFVVLVSLVPSMARMAGMAGTSAAQVKQEVPKAESVKETRHPVVLGSQVLFYIRAPVKYLGPEARAKAISERATRLAEDVFVRPETLTIADDAFTTDIVAGDVIVMLVTDADAQADGRGWTRQELAKQYVEKLHAGIEQYRRDYSRKSILLGLLYSIIATVFLVGILLFLRKLRAKVDAFITARIAARIQAIHIQSFEIVRAQRLRTLLLGSLKFAEVFCVIIIFYAYVHIVLAFFPWTRGFASQLLHYVLLPFTVMGRAALAQVPNLFFLTILIVITRYALKLLRLFFAGVEAGRVTISGFDPEWAQPTAKIVRVLVVAFAAVVAFPYIPGSESPAFKGVSIFLGVLFSLGSSSAISNVVAGLTMTYRRAFKVGDRVGIGELRGDVTEMRLLVTHLKTPKNEEIVIPNSTILNSHVVNYSTEARKQGLILHTAITIGYDAPWRKVHELLISAALATANILREPRPFVLQTALNDFYVTYEINGYTDNPHAMLKTYSELHQNIQDKFNEGGMEIMSPHYTQLRDGNQVTIPEEYRSREYVPGSLRITGKITTDPERE
jgi:small-conductance mechanosensitive channel